MSSFNAALATDLIDFGSSPLSLLSNGTELDYTMGNAEDPLIDQFILSDLAIAPPKISGVIRPPDISGTIDTPDTALARLGKITKHRPAQIQTQSAREEIRPFREEGNNLHASAQPFYPKAAEARNPPAEVQTFAFANQEIPVSFFPAQPFPNQPNPEWEVPPASPSGTGKFWAYSAKLAAFLYRDGSPPNSPPKGYSAFSRQNRAAEPLHQRGPIRSKYSGESPGAPRKMDRKMGRAYKWNAPYNIQNRYRPSFAYKRRTDDDDDHTFTERFGQMLTKRRNQKVANRMMKMAENPELLERILDHD